MLLWTYGESGGARSRNNEKTLLQRLDQNFHAAIRLLGINAAPGRHDIVGASVAL